MESWNLDFCDETTLSLTCLCKTDQTTYCGWCLDTIIISDTMAEELDGEEFVVDKILDKRTRNGKIEYYLSWKVIKLTNQNTHLNILTNHNPGIWTRGEHMGAKRESRLSRVDQSVWGQSQDEKRAGKEKECWGWGWRTCRQEASPRRGHEVMITNQNYCPLTMLTNQTTRIWPRPAGRADHRSNRQFRRAHVPHQVERKWRGWPGGGQTGEHEMSSGMSSTNRNTA